ncbi:hypothetical protein VNO77_11123 [Canavalia gladiata]|uniref:Uncharacterized protein n=1 Tax=Canavalia gladiata TaxID=3824 RepID=A0AAN9MBN9_CANGL
MEGTVSRGIQCKILVLPIPSLSSNQREEYQRKPVFKPNLVTGTADETSNSGLQVMYCEKSISIIHYC